MLPPYMLYEFARNRYKELLYGTVKVRQCRPHRPIKFGHWNRIGRGKSSHEPTEQNSVLLNRGRPWIWMKKT